MEKIEEAKIGFVAGFVAGVAITNYVSLAVGLILGFICAAVIYFRQEIWKAFQDYREKAKKANEAKKK